MKCAVQFVKLTCMVILLGSCIFSCRKNDDTPDEPDPPVNQGDPSHPDTLSNHLQFMGAIKKQGAIPQGAAGSSLKISFKDTLYLTDEVKTPFKFLHLDTTKNVAGVYIQVNATFTGGTHATYYYDVPEVKELADNDTVSVIMVGVDPKGLIDTDGVPPAGSPTRTFRITIVPYGRDRQAIATDTRPVKVSDPKVDPTGNFGPCGLVLPPGEYWDWHLSYILNPDGNTFSFYNDQDMIHGAGGQFINGSCCNGNSYYGICPGNTTTNARLLFKTFTQYAEENFKFFSDGTFARFTKILNSNPFPSESNFCGTGPGVVRESLSNVSYFGNYTVRSITPPPALQEFGDSLTLTLQTTSSTGLGYGNPGGIIHHLNCNFLTLIQLDQEGGNNHLYKYYTRMTSLGAWYLFG